MQGFSRNDNPKTPVTSSQDSLCRIVLETTLRLELDLRGLHGPRPGRIKHVGVLYFQNVSISMTSICSV